VVFDTRNEGSKVVHTRVRAGGGFTLIELLIAILVIGILAAIAIPSFAVVKLKSFDASAKSDLRNMLTAQEAYFSEHQAYTDIAVPPGGRGDLDGNGAEDFRASERVSLGATAYSDGILVTSAHSASSNTWCLNSSATLATAPGAIVQGTSC
jgi:prepilin-type N-terminal cleavage/methylation domain-containing protein